MKAVGVSALVIFGLACVWAAFAAMRYGKIVANDYLVVSRSTSPQSFWTFISLNFGLGVGCIALAFYAAVSLG